MTRTTLVYLGTTQVLLGQQGLIHPSMVHREPQIPQSRNHGEVEQRGRDHIPSEFDASGLQLLLFLSFVNVQDTLHVFVSLA